MQEEKTEKEKKGGALTSTWQRAVPLFELEGLGGRGDGRE